MFDFGNYIHVLGCKENGPEEESKKSKPVHYYSWIFVCY